MSAIELIFLWNENLIEFFCEEKTMDMSIRFSKFAIFTALVGSTLTLHAEGVQEGDVFAKNKISLGQASQIAEKQDQSKAINVEFDIEKERALWEVKTLSNTGVREYKVDATSGAIIKVEDEHIRGRLTNFITGMNLKDLEAAKTTLLQAIATAEKSLNGKVVKVQVEHEHDAIQYDISVRTGNVTKKVKIEAATGKAM
jgi:uncharacterized membrane protein YkoI